MGWFKRIKDGITTSTKDKKETPEGLWYKCTKCNELTPSEDHAKNLYVCSCGYHQRIGSKDYFKILFDNGKATKFKELNSNLAPTDPLKFEDTKKYIVRIKDSQKKVYFDIYGDLYVNGSETDSVKFTSESGNLHNIDSWSGLRFWSTPHEDGAQVGLTPVLAEPGRHAARVPVRHH